MVLFSVLSALHVFLEAFTIITDHNRELKEQRRECQRECFITINLLLNKVTRAGINQLVTFPSPSLEIFVKSSTLWVFKEREQQSTNHFDLQVT